ncbi:NAD+ synthase [Sphingobacterium corticibacter]|uniref:Glutamine-dependent NAD(+) synthetase n=1 Tax=Sphingobacterium corticibacter TaxID=2171749 RepID=A0A2T8HLA5_9SPHI|nr:NAD+ synthase [Sphingobacterium corticibacter]PVH26228.1 NAD+ synthase [Sphingobacterium corticibacter]
MKIALAQLNYRIGDFETDTAQIIETINKAKKQGNELIIFAELAIGGYPAKDLLRNPAYLNACEKALHEIASACCDIACIIGAPIRNNHSEGKHLFNAALVIEQGEVKHTVKKTYLPDYDVFDEYRYFEPNKDVHCVTIGNTKIALTICEDLWDNGVDNTYMGDIIQDLAVEKPDLIVNIAASPFSYTHHQTRLDIMRRAVLRTQAPLIYLNQVGAHTDIIFDGRSFVLDSNGDVVTVLSAFEADFAELSLEKGEFQLKEHREVYLPGSEISQIHAALVFGLKEYFTKSGFKKAVLGLSGGLDSAIVAALACEALGADNVLAILLPSKYSSDHSLKDALDLVSNTGCNHHIVPIHSMVEAYDDTLSDLFSGLQPDITEENIQARIRATILMATANKFGHILLNTSNKSEASVGYGTLYGDMAGAISVIGDVYKSQAYQLAEYINRHHEIIPTNTIVKPPSAELRPDQKDSDSLPDYELLDSILYQLIEQEKSGQEIVPLGFDEEMVLRVQNMLNRAEFKRFQAPPILRISPKAFGPGRVIPLVAKYPS